MSTVASFPMQDTPTAYDQTQQQATVYDQLLTTAKQAGFQDRKPNEKNQDYLQRLVLAISKVSDEAWNALTPETQNWFNLAGGAINTLQRIPDCPGYEPAPEPESAGPIKRQKINPPKEVQPRITTRIRQLVLLNPSWNVKQIMQGLEDEGWQDISKGTVNVQMAAVKTVVRDAEDLGFTFIRPNQSDQSSPDQSGVQ